MSKSHSILSSAAVQGYFVLLVGCGVGLLFSIPSAASVADLAELQWKSSPVAFHLTFVTLLSLLGAFRGVAAAGWDAPERRILTHLAVHILAGQLIVLPYLVFSRVLLPASGLSLPLLATYATITAFMFSVIELRLGRWGRARQVHTLLLQYAAVGLLFLLPWAISVIPGVPPTVTLFSPIGAALKITQAASASEPAVALAFVTLMTLVQLVCLRRAAGRNHAV